MTRSTTARIRSLMQSKPSPGGLALETNLGERHRHGCRCALGSRTTNAFDGLPLIVLFLGWATRVDTTWICRRRIAFQVLSRTCLSPMPVVVDRSERLDAAYKHLQRESLKVTWGLESSGASCELIAPRRRHDRGWCPNCALLGLRVVKRNDDQGHPLELDTNLDKLLTLLVAIWKVDFGMRPIGGLWTMFNV